MGIVKTLGSLNFINNSKYMLINSGLNFGLKMISNILIVRYIGAYNNGIYSYIYAVSAIFFSISEFGLESIVVREGTFDRYQPEKLLGTAVLFRCITGSVAATIFILYMISRGCNRDYLIFSGLVCISYIGQAFYSFKAYMISKYNAKDFFFSQNVILIIFFVFKLLFVFCKMNLRYIFLINTLEVFISGVVYYWIYGKNNNFSLRYSRELFSMFFKEGIPLTVASLAIIIYMRCDQIMVRDFLGEQSLGIYSVAVTLAEFWYFIPTTINSAMSPKLISIMQTDDKKRIEECFGLYYRVMLLLSVGASFIISFLAFWVVTFMYGLEYAESVTILKLYIWAGIFVCLGLVRGVYLIYHKYNTFNATITVIACLLNITLNYLLIPQMGGSGAALSTVVSYAFSALGSSLLWENTRKMGVIQLKSLFLPYIFMYLKQHNSSIKGK